MAETWLWTSFILQTSRCMILSMFHNIGCTPSGGDLGKSHPSLKFCSMASSSDVPSGLSSINERLRAGRLVASGMAASDPAGINLSDCPDDPFSVWDMVGWTQAPMTSNIFQANDGYESSDIDFMVERIVLTVRTCLHYIVTDLLAHNKGPAPRISDKIIPFMREPSLPCSHLRRHLVYRARNLPYNNPQPFPYTVLPYNQYVGDVQ